MNCKITPIWARGCPKKLVKAFLFDYSGDDSIYVDPHCGAFVIKSILVDPRMEHPWKTLLRLTAGKDQIGTLRRLSIITIKAYHSSNLVVEESLGDQRIRFQKIASTTASLTNLISAPSVIRNTAFIELLYKEMAWNLFVLEGLAANVWKPIRTKHSGRGPETKNLKIATQYGLKQTYFIRTLSLYMRTRFGKPLHPIVAQITNAAFSNSVNAEVTEDAVRQATKDLKTVQEANNFH